MAKIDQVHTPPLEEVTWRVLVAARVDLIVIRKCIDCALIIRMIYLSFCGSAMSLVMTFTADGRVWQHLISAWLATKQNL